MNEIEYWPTYLKRKDEKDEMKKKKKNRNTCRTDISLEMLRYLNLHSNAYSESVFELP